MKSLSVRQRRGWQSRRVGWASGKQYEAVARLKKRKTAEGILTMLRRGFKLLGGAHMPDVVKSEREARRKIIRHWIRLSREKRPSIDEISAFAKTAAQQNAKAFVPARPQSV